jgi:hypothetical protein
MTGLSAMMKASQVKCLEMRVDETMEMFRREFGLSDGDYIEIDRGKGWKQHRILSVDSCWYNARGGHTAYVRLLSLTASGSMSPCRGAYLTCSPSGKTLSVMLPRNAKLRVAKQRSKQ